MSKKRKKRRNYNTEELPSYSYCRLLRFQRSNIMLSPLLVALTLGAVALLLFGVAALGLRLGVRQPDGGRTAQVGRLFAGGVLLSTATVHMLADAVEMLAEITEFPLGLSCLGVGYLLTVGVESWARAAVNTRRLAPPPNDNDAAVKPEDTTASCTLVPIVSRLAKAANKVTLVSALTLHSFIAGSSYQRASATSLSSNAPRTLQASRSARSSRCDS